MRQFATDHSIIEFVKLLEAQLNRTLSYEEFEEITSGQIKELFNTMNSLSHLPDLVVKGDLEVNGNISTSTDSLSLEGHDHDDRYYSKEDFIAIADKSMSTPLSQKLSFTNENGLGNLRWNRSEGLQYLNTDKDEWCSVNSIGPITDYRLVEQPIYYVYIKNGVNRTYEISLDVLKPTQPPNDSIFNIPELNIYGYRIRSVTAFAFSDGDAIQLNNWELYIKPYIEGSKLYIPISDINDIKVNDEEMLMFFASIEIDVLVTMNGQIIASSSEIVVASHDLDIPIVDNIFSKNVYYDGESHAGLTGLPEQFYNFSFYDDNHRKIGDNSPTDIGRYIVEIYQKVEDTIPEFPIVTRSFEIMDPREALRFLPKQERIVLKINGKTVGNVECHLQDTVYSIINRYIETLSDDSNTQKDIEWKPVASDIGDATGQVLASLDGNGSVPYESNVLDEYDMYTVECGDDTLKKVNDALLQAFPSCGGLGLWIGSGTGFANNGFYLAYVGNDWTFTVNDNIPTQGEYMEYANQTYVYPGDTINLRYGLTIAVDEI